MKPRFPVLFGKLENPETLTFALLLCGPISFFLGLKTVSEEEERAQRRAEPPPARPPFLWFTLPVRR